MKPATRFSSLALRRAVGGTLRAQSPANGIIARAAAPAASQVGRMTAVRAFHGSAGSRSIMPDAENPAPREAEDNDVATVPTDIPTSEFHERADRFLEELVERLEEQQDRTPDVEVEYSVRSSSHSAPLSSLSKSNNTQAGVLKVDLISKGLSYVLNKQPPNKQIWLSSPITGPKRFDWVAMQESMNHKEGSGTGDWVYLRDGTSLTDIIRKELAVDVGVDDEAPR
jgi:frataxin